MKIKIYSLFSLLSLCVVVNAFGTYCTANPESAGTSGPTAELLIITPEALVADLYKQHNANRSPFFQTKSRARVDKYFTKATADLIWKDAVSSEGEVGALEGDPLYSAQDMKIRNFAIGKAKIKGDSGVVAVTFTNYGKKQTVTFLLQMVNGVWKIDDIKWPEGDSMVDAIKETYPAKLN
ncbi:MAG: DUF3828 domain-containing protein [Pyrinomonadaceae bacterium]